MKFSKSLIPRIFLILFINQILFNAPKAQSAEKIKIIYSIFSKTVTVLENMLYVILILSAACVFGILKII